MLQNETFIAAFGWNVGQLSYIKTNCKIKKINTNFSVLLIYYLITLHVDVERIPKTKSLKDRFCDFDSAGAAIGQKDHLSAPSASWCLVSDPKPPYTFWNHITLYKIMILLLNISFNFNFIYLFMQLLIKKI